MNFGSHRLMLQHRVTSSAWATVFFLCLTASLTSAQTIAWQAPYGLSTATEKAVKVKTDAAGNVYVVGNSGNDILTLKYNAAGTLQWQTRYSEIYSNPDLGDSVGSREQASDLQVDAAGNVYVTGTWYPINNCQRTEAITIKYNTAGVQQWKAVAAQGACGDQRMHAPHSSLDANGNVYVAVSYFNAQSTGFITLQKLTATGSTVWTQTYQAAVSPQPLQLLANDLHVDGSGNAYITGRIYSGSDNFLTLKYTNAGSLQWERQYNFSADENEAAVKVKTDAAGNVYVAGSSSRDMALVKYSATGVQQWASRFNNTYYDYDEDAYYNTSDYASDLLVDAAGNAAVAGGSYASVNCDYTRGIVVRYNASGASQGSSQVLMAMCSPIVSGPYLTSNGDGNIYAAASFSSGSSSNNAVVVQKLASNGSLIWEKNTSYEDTPYYVVETNALHADSNGNVYVANTTPYFNEGDFLTIKYAAPSAARTTVRINCGGDTFTTTAGLVFEADKYGSGSVKVPARQVAPIANSADDELYYTDRVASVDYGTFQYQIPVANGDYQVNLLFAETYFTTAGKRVLSVKAEGNSILSNYDIYANQGYRSAATKTARVTVADGYLTLHFSATANRPKINAIEVIPATTIARGKESEAKELTSTLSASPNPFTEQAAIRYQAAATGQATIAVYHLNGTLVKSLFQGELSAGETKDLSFNGSSLPTGVYLVKAASASKVEHIKLVLNH